MPDFRIVSESFKELSLLEEMLREIAQKTNNRIEKDVDAEYGTFFYIINPLTGFNISFSVYDKKEFIESYNEKYGGIFSVHWSNKMPIGDIDNFMMPLIKELREYLPNVFVDDYANSDNDLITIDEFIKKGEE